MKVTRCKYGHYYDKAYFRECPHCCRARGGRDEDIIIGKNELSTDLSGKNFWPLYLFSAGGRLRAVFQTGLLRDLTGGISGSASVAGSLA